MNIAKFLRKPILDSICKRLVDWFLNSYSKEHWWITASVCVYVSVCVCVCVCVCVYVCACVCLRSFTVKASSVWNSWNPVSMDASQMHLWDLNGIMVWVVFKKDIEEKHLRRPDKNCYFFCKVNILERF